MREERIICCCCTHTDDLETQKANAVRLVRPRGEGTNHLGHFLLANLLLPDIQKAPEGSLKRVVIVGSITGAPCAAR